MSGHLFIGDALIRHTCTICGNMGTGREWACTNETRTPAQILKHALREERQARRPRGWTQRT